MNSSSWPNVVSSMTSVFLRVAPATNFCLSLDCSPGFRSRWGEATLVIVDLPSGRRFDPEDGTCPPGIKNADRADASVPREVCEIVAVVVSLGRFNVAVVVDVEKRGIGASVFVVYASSATNEISCRCFFSNISSNIFYNVFLQSSTDILLVVQKDV